MNIMGVDSIKNQGVATKLFIINAIYTMTLFVWPAFFMASAFLGDGATASNPVSFWVYVIIYAIIVYLFLVPLSFTCWIAYHLRNYKLSLWLANLAALSPIVVISVVGGALLREIITS